ncbi:MAG TPA: winged helix-turn-helix domain-containing protein [Streptosporangiaceae bacterium]|nr:winged helix-turn-helix domain-containing protein [Streptosporangiaceae bacterium]
MEAGPAAHGWDQDQRWTLARAASLADRLFGVSCTPRGMSFPLHRLGYSPQVPVHRAVERDDAAIAEWRAVTWAKARG